MPESFSRMPSQYDEEPQGDGIYSTRRMVAMGVICSVVLAGAWYLSRDSSEEKPSTPQASPSSLTLECNAVEPDKWKEAGTTKLNLDVYAQKLDKTREEISKQLLGDVACNTEVPFRLLSEDMSLVVDGFDGRCTLIGPAYRKKPKDPKQISPSKYALALCSKS